MKIEAFGRYKIRGELGRGGMGIVYHAFDPHFDREVAVKVLPREFLYELKFKERFLHEARTVASLEHSAIVPVYDFGEEDGQPFMVMRYMRGGSLKARIANGPMDADETCTVMARVAAALDFVHRRGVLHRDIKPENILFDEEGDAYLSDFGIARLLELSGTMTIIGTPAYMSPEQAEGQQTLDPRSDLYALGAVLFEMLSGRQPFEGATPLKIMLMHLTDPIPSLSVLSPDLPLALDPVIARAMSKRPEDRYSSASDLLDALQASHQPESTPALGPQIVSGGRLGEIFTLAWSPDNRSLVCGNSGGVLRAWNTRTWEERQVKAHRENIFDLTFTLSGRTLVTGAEDLLLNLWHGHTLAAQSTLGQTSTAIYCVASSPDERYIACGTFRGELVVWQRDTQARIMSRRDAMATLGVCFSPDGRYMIASMTPPDRIAIFDTARFELQREIRVRRTRPQTTYLRRLRFNPSGTWLATAAFDGTPRVWDFASGQVMAELGDGRNCFSDVDFDPTGTLLAVGDTEGQVSVWDIPERRLALALTGHEGITKSVAFNRTGRLLASGGHDGTLRLWDVDEESPTCGTCVRTIR